MKIVTGKEMTKIEKQSYEEKGLHLAQVYMENAGTKVAEFVDTYVHERLGLKEKNKSKVLLLCAKGNNSGDAYVCGRILCEMGYKVCALQITPIEEATDLCKLNHKKFMQSGGRLSQSLKNDLSGTDLVVDGLLGTGFSGDLRSNYLNTIQEVNKAQKVVVSIDVPSGLSADEGARENKQVIIKANITLYLGLPKLGFFLEDSMNHLGELHHIDFGLEEKYIAAHQSSYTLLTKKQCQSFLPKYLRTTNKYQQGFLTTLAGSPGMTGAALLTTLAAFRSGAGIVKLLCSEEMIKQFSHSYPELVKIAYDDKGSKQLLEVINKSDACIIGPGIGLAKKTADLLENLIPQIKKPLLLDADGLNIFAKSGFSLPEEVVMTPHLGELARILKLDKTPRVNQELLDRVRLFSKSNKVTVVVKGSPTFVVMPDGIVYVCPVGDPGMATAGSGDVLSGMIGAFMAQGLSCKKAALLGVWLHGKAGSLAADKKTSFSLMASDIIDYISAAIKSLIK